MHANPPDAARFGDALVALGEAAGILDRLAADLAAVQPLLAGNESIRRFLADPTVGAEGKRSALRELLGDRVHGLLLHFLLILGDMDLMTRIPTVAERFFARVAEQRHQMAGVLISAQPLTDTQVAEIHRETGRILGKNVDLRVRVDTNILGGIRIQVGDFVLDATVDRHLDELRQQLLA